MSTPADSDAGNGAGPRRRSLPVWMKMISTILVVVALVAAAWLALSGEAIVSTAHTRNFHDLDVAARGLETWPESLRTLAKAQFIQGNVRPASAMQRDDGWTYRVIVRHPTIGRYQLLYAVRPTEADCLALRQRIEAHERMRMPFVASNRSGEGPQLKIVDSMPLRELLYADRSDATALPANGMGIDGIAADGRSDGPPALWPTSSFLCYGTVVPISRLLSLEKSGTRFVNFLIVDGDRRVVRQLGEPAVPIDSLDQLVPQESILSAAVASAVPGSARTTDRAKPARLADALEPVTLQVAQRSYLGYVRPFHLPPGVPGCDTGHMAQAPPPVPSADDTAVEGPKVEAATQAYPAPTEPCFLVGLMPRITLWRSALSVAQVPGTAFILVFVLLLSLVPTLQLLMIGPGEAISRTTAIFVVAGLLFAVGTATIATTFALDVARERQAARLQGEAIARRMAGRVAIEIRQALGELTALEDRNRGLLSGTSNDADVIEPRPFDARGAPGSAAAPASARMLSLIGDNGRGLACGARTLRFSDSAGSRTNIGGRAYFMRLRDGDYDGVVDDRGRPQHYTIDQVLSQTDGSETTALAMTPWPRAGHPAAGTACVPVAVLATTTLRELIAPVLPWPYSFMVVDGRKPDGTLPVLFHSVAHRAAVETLASALDDNGLAELRHWFTAQLAGGHGETGRFAARYDGNHNQFAAVSIDGTPWILLVDHEIDQVDRVASQTALIALGNWITWSAAAPILYWLFRRGYLAWRGRPFRVGRDLQRFWPHQRPNRAYRRQFHVLLCIAVLAVLMLLMFAGSGMVTPALTLAALLCVGLCFAAFRANSRLDSVEALRPDTERDFRAMLGATAICVAIVPALALWNDARNFVLIQKDAQQLAGLVGPGGAIEQRQSALARLKPVPTSPEPAAAGGAPSFPGCEPVTRCFAGVAATIGGGIDETDLSGLAGTLARWVVGTASTRHACDPPAAPPEGIRALCVSGDGDRPRYGLGPRVSPAAWTAEGGWIDLLAVVAIGAILFGGLWQLLGRALRAMAGFGIPLEAITRPNLYVGDPRRAPSITVATVLPDRALLVGSPPVLRRRFFDRQAPGGGYVMVDVAARGVLQLGPDDTRIVAFGLQLVLNDADRRREALERLEACDRHLRDVPGSKMVIMSALSPLERIIDAFERDRDDPDGSQSLLKYREQLRWSLLLERFATFSFRAVDNYNPARNWVKARLARMREAVATPDDPRAGQDRAAIVEKMLAEIRWLPAHVVESAIGVTITSRIAALAQRRRRLAGVYPLHDIYYQWVIVPLAIDWALRLKPASKQAAIDYLRGIVIEHYQQCWSSSTVAERVVLDHLAHDRFVNVEGACIALTSLVRRGLVVFDPVPRLMNDSFRMFVGQAERPERIREWRALQPVGSWARARLPLLVGLPLAAVFMLAAAIWSGVDLAVLLPLFLAGVPALVSQVGRIFRTQTS